MWIKFILKDVVSEVLILLKAHLDLGYYKNPAGLRRTWRSAGGWMLPFGQEASKLTIKIMELAFGLEGISWGYPVWPPAQNRSNWSRYWSPEHLKSSPPGSLFQVKKKPTNWLTKNTMGLKILLCNWNFPCFSLCPLPVLLSACVPCSLAPAGPMGCTWATLTLPFPWLSKRASLSQLHLVCCVHHPLTFLPLFSQ